MHAVERERMEREEADYAAWMTEERRIAEERANVAYVEWCEDHDWDPDDEESMQEWEDWCVSEAERRDDERMW